MPVQITKAASGSQTENIFANYAFYNFASRWCRLKTYIFGPRAWAKNTCWFGPETSFFVRTCTRKTHLAKMSYVSYKFASLNFKIFKIYLFGGYFCSKQQRIISKTRMFQISRINCRFRLNEMQNPIVNPRTHTPYHAVLCSLGLMFTLKFTITRTLALALTFMMADVRAHAAHAHGHVSTESTSQSSTQ